MANERQRIGAAREDAATALTTLTNAAEWLDKVIEGGSVHTEQLTVLRDRLWAMADATRGVEHELAQIHAVERQTTH